MAVLSHHMDLSLGCSPQAKHALHGNQSSWGLNKNVRFVFYKPLLLVTMTETKDPPVEERKQSVIVGCWWAGERYVQNQMKHQNFSTPFIPLSSHLQIQISSFRSLVLNIAKFNQNIPHLIVYETLMPKIGC